MAIESMSKLRDLFYEALLPDSNGSYCQKHWWGVYENVPRFRFAAVREYIVDLTERGILEEAKTPSILTELGRLENSGATRIC